MSGKRVTLLGATGLLMIFIALKWNAVNRHQKFLRDVQNSRVEADYRDKMRDANRRETFGMMRRAAERETKCLKEEGKFDEMLESGRVPSCVAGGRFLVFVFPSHEQEGANLAMESFCEHLESKQHQLEQLSALIAKCGSPRLSCYSGEADLLSADDRWSYWEVFGPLEVLLPSDNCLIVYDIEREIPLFGASGSLTGMPEDSPYFDLVKSRPRSGGN